MKELVINLLPVVIVVLLSVLAYKLGYKRAVYKVIITFVEQAEQALGSKMGRAKKEQVLKRIYSELPMYVTVLLPQSVASKWIDDIVALAKRKIIDEADKLNK